jgi:hypothetical protein
MGQCAVVAIPAFKHDIVYFVAKHYLAFAAHLLTGMIQLL